MTLLYKQHNILYGYDVRHPTELFGPYSVRHTIKSLVQEHIFSWTQLVVPNTYTYWLLVIIPIWQFLNKTRSEIILFFVVTPGNLLV